MKAVIAAGGRATRLRPITHTFNKHLIPLANRPMLEYAIEKIVEANITDIIINVNPGETEMMRTAFGDGERWNAKITYVEQQGGAKGIAHAVANAEPYLKGERFVFFLGDNILVGDIRRMRERFEAEQLDCMVMLSRVKHPNRFGVPEFNPDGTIRRAIEKPENPPSPFAITGIYFFNERYFDAFKLMKPSARGEYEITDMITWYIENGRVGHEEITGWWKDTGKPEDLLEGNALILNQIIDRQQIEGVHISPGSVVQGNAKIGKGTVIGPNVLVRGPVIIGENCEITESYVGPYTSIGNRVRIANTEIEHSIILDDAIIDCEKRIVDSIIGLKTTIISSRHSLPRGNKLVVGDNAVVEL